MPETVPFRVSVNVLMVSVLFAPVKIREPFIVGLPVNENALADEALNSRFPNLAADIVLPIPVMLILPLPVLVWVPVPAMLPAQVITFPPSPRVPVSVSVVPTLKLFPMEVVPAAAV